MTQLPGPTTNSNKFALAAILCVYGGGIIAFLAIYGVLQERIMSYPYGHDMFTFSVFLVMLNRLFGLAFAAIMIFFKGEAMTPQAPIWKYCAVAITNVCASACQYSALRWISFPVLSVAKSFKMFPVMMWGIAISGKKYGLTDWLLALGVSIGVSMFVLTGSVAAPDVMPSETTDIIGIALLAGFLMFDGFTSTFQEKLFKEHCTSTHNQMLYINLAGSIISLCTVYGRGNLTLSAVFCREHPLLLMDASILSIAVVGAQWCIYSFIQLFGAVAFAAAINVRQVVSILISYIYYGHSFTVLQVVGLVFVFGALFCKSYTGLLGGTEARAPHDHAKSAKACLAPEAEKITNYDATTGNVANKDEV